MSRKKTNKKKAAHQKKQLVKKIPTSFFVVSIFVFLFTTIPWHLYTERPIVFSKIDVPRSYAINQGSLKLNISLRNGGGTDIRVDIVVVLESVIKPNSDMAPIIYGATTLRIPTVLAAREQDFRTYNISIYVPYLCEAFRISIILYMVSSLATIFAEHQPLCPTNFTYTKQGGGGYSLYFFSW